MTKRWLSISFTHGHVGVGLVAILFLMALFGGFALWQTNQIAGLTVRLYTHPFAVSNATLRIQLSLLRIHHLLTETILLDQKNLLPNDLRDEIEQEEQAILEDFSLIQERFLGDKEDVMRATQSVMAWHPVVDHILALLEKGDYVGAKQLMKTREAVQMAEISTQTKAIELFARAKAADFYSKSQDLQNSAFINSLELILATLFLSSVIAVVLFLKNAATEQAYLASQQAFRESERFTLSAIDAISSHLCVLNEQGIIIATNQSWRDFSRNYACDAAGLGEGSNYLTVCDAVQGEDRVISQAVADGIRAVLSGQQQDFSFEYSCPVLEEVMWFMLRVTRFHGDGPCFVTVTHDNITEIKRVEELLRNVNKLLEERVQQRTRELERSNQDLQQFAYIASHDLQEPLRQISGFAQLLKRRYHGHMDSKSDQFIDYMVEGCQRMVNMINSLLHYSRVSTHGIDLRPITVETLLERAQINLLTKINETETVITRDVLSVTLWGDEQQLLQLMQNLLSNAIKFCQLGQKPRIHVSVQRQGNDWVVSVQDNGIGIESQYADRIFVIFQRLHLRTEFDGTGIGLAVCKRIIERHNGRIWFTSELGQGSTFSFSLPSQGG
ncbi:MAG: GHKL domain-containing protein [Magnetococcales bacterium]|nr:GHKL domain-containing protein [Magnetococcales bacterium]